MADKRIPELPIKNLVEGGMVAAIYDFATDTTYQVPLTLLGVSANPYEYWQPAPLGSYALDQIVIDTDRWWRSLVAGNEDNVPEEGPFWTEVSKEGLSQGLQRVAIDTAPAVIELDMVGAKEIIFVATPAINADKVLSFLNFENILEVRSFKLEIVGAPRVLEFPANVLMDAAEWDSGANELTLYDDGKYEFWMTYDDVSNEFLVKKVGGPFN